MEMKELETRRLRSGKEETEKWKEEGECRVEGRRNRRRKDSEWSVKRWRVGKGIRRS